MELTIYTDASFGKRQAAIGLVFVPRIHEDVAAVVQQQINNVNEAEVFAITEALTIVASKITLPHRSTITIATDSQHAIRCFENSPPEILKALRVNHTVTLKPVKGHSDDGYNHIADRLAVKTRKQANRISSSPK